MSLGVQAQAAAPLAEDVVRDPLPFLVAAGEQLAASLDYEQTLQRLLDIVVTNLADMCSIHLLDDDGRFRRIAAQHRSPDVTAISIALGDYYIDSGKVDGPIHRLLAGEHSLLSSPVTQADFEVIVRDEHRDSFLKRLGVTSAIVVPLTARGRPFGVLCMATSERPRFGLAHLHLAQEIGRRAAVALDTARLYRAASESRHEAEQARRRTAFLAEASAALATSLEIRTTLQTVVRLAVPEMAESCSVALLDDDGTMRRVAVAHANPELQALLDGHSPIVPIRNRPSHPMAVVLETGRPLVENTITDEARRSYADGEYLDLLRCMGVRARLLVPLEARGRRIGTLTLADSDPGRAFDDDDVTLGVELAARAALALDNARLYRRVTDSEETLRRLVHQLMVAQEEERRRLAGEIHDGFAQMASGLHQLLEAYAHEFPSGSGAARHRMKLAIGLAQRTVAEIRQVLAGLRPTVLDDFGLARGLRAYADSLIVEGLAVCFSESIGPIRLAPEREIALFRLAQEALTNVRKHAAVREAWLQLGHDGESIMLEVEDQGRGFDPSALEREYRPGERLGLLSMHERIAQVTGTMEIKSRPGEGTIVRAVVPLADPARL